MKKLISVLLFTFSTVTFAHYDGLTCHPHNNGWDGWLDMARCTGYGWAPGYCSPQDDCEECKYNRNKNHDPDLRDSKVFFLPYQVTHDEFRRQCIEVGMSNNRCEKIVEVMMICE